MNTLIERLEVWIRAHRPEYLEKLGSGLDQKTLDEFEKKHELKLSNAFRAFYSWRNGQPSDCFDSLQYNFAFMSLDTIGQAKDDLDGMIGTDFDSPNWWQRDWVPFLDNGGGDLMCLDASGKIIWFLHDDEERSVEHESFEEWLRSLVESMEDGTLELN